VVVAEQVQQAVNERPLPGLAGHLRAEHGVAELPRDPNGKVLKRLLREQY